MPRQGWSQDVVERVNSRLTSFFDTKLALARQTSSQAEELVDAVAALTMRGGKRLRPAALTAGYRAANAGGDVMKTLELCACLELLQSYLLIQDDWMDDDAERRGGPAVHVLLSKRHGDTQLGASLAILAADLACGFAWELLLEAPFPGGRQSEGVAAFNEMHWEVVCGQQLDLLGHPDVALMHQLKTGSYTVRGPLRLGALLGNANEQQLDALERFGRPMGMAFQLRDDLLGTFGDASALGKPIGNDLKRGKNTSLVAQARAKLTASELAPLQRVMGNANATDDEVELATALLVDCGARAEVEASLAGLLAEATAVLDAAPLSAQGISMLGELVELLAVRDR